MGRSKDERKAILNSNRLIAKATKDGPKSKQQLMLFLSFDITDSTKQKILHLDKWSEIIDILVNTKFQCMNYWKFNGDEILYKRNINSLEFVCRIIEAAYSHLKKLNLALSKIISDLSVKGTVWLALSDTAHTTSSCNFSFEIEDEIDFVGKSIDEGFRLTKCSSTNKIAIDPKIVYILLDTYKILRDSRRLESEIPFFKSQEDCSDEELNDLEESIIKILNNLHLIGYTKCKGVWDDKPFPVYWLYDDTRSSCIKYDEFFCGEHLWQKDIASISKSQNAINSAYDNLNDIFKQIGVNKEIEDIYKFLIMEGDVEISATSKANLYYMVVCINPTTHNVMIAKRSSKRKHLKNVWDFGNVKYQNINMKDTIVKEYKNTFGIDIELIVDTGRGDNLKPFGYCTIYRNRKPHNSILCHAYIKNPSDFTDEALVEYIMTNKSSVYDEVRFVSAEDVEGFKDLTLDQIRADSELAEYEINTPFPDNTCIMYFKDSIKGAVHES